MPPVTAPELTLPTSDSKSEEIASQYYPVPPLKLQNGVLFYERRASCSPHMC